MKLPTDEAPALSARIQFIPRGQILQSAIQPRKDFADADLADLRGSMKTHGFLANFPLLIRPINEVNVVPDDAGTKASVYVRTGEGEWTLFGTAETDEQAAELMLKAHRFEIICGERRWRVAGELGIDLLPSMLRVMTDEQALQIALIENLQRAGLNPMEEAMGYQRLDGMLLAEHPDWNERQRCAEISEKIGRPEQTVRDRLLLCALRGEIAGEAIINGRISAQHGRLLSRLPSRELRDELMRKILSPTFGDGCMSTRQLELLLQDYKRELRAAQFDTKDATLVPLTLDPGTKARQSGGACTDCPFNTKNLDESDSGRGTKFHACLNPACFSLKCEADFERWRTRMESEGKVTLPARENTELWDHTGKRLAHNTRFVELNDKPADTDLKTTVQAEKVGTYKDLIKGREVPVTYVRDDSGKVHEVVARDLAVQASVENKHHVFRDEPKQQTAKPETKVDAAAEGLKRDAEAQKQREEDEQAREEKERIWHARVGALVRSIEARPKPAHGFFKALWVALSPYFEQGICLAAERRGLLSEKFQSWAAKVSEVGESAIAAAFVEIILQEGFWSDGEDENPLLKTLAKAYEVDLKAPTKVARDQLKAERATVEEACEIASAMDWKSEKTEAEQFRWNTANIAENPDRCELQFPKAAKITASISVALTVEGWVFGWFVQGPKFGTSKACTAPSVKYGTRQLAIRTAFLELADYLGKNKAHESAIKRVQDWLNTVLQKQPNGKSPRRTGKAALAELKASKKGGK
jgi:ParB/RepB/Spo0J family partition protein